MTLLRSTPARPTAARSDAGALERLRRFGRPPRLIGLDVARAIAVVGMIGVHVGVIDHSFIWGRPATWDALVNGRSAILFAVLAGISIALVSGRTSIPQDLDLPELRLRLGARGAVIFTIGLVLELLGTGVVVILTLYGVLYLAAIPALQWSRRRLWITASCLALVSPVLVVLLQSLAPGFYGRGGVGLVFGLYPLTAWLAFLLAGLAIGRTDLSSVRTALVLLGGGAIVSTIGYAIAAVTAIEPPGIGGGTPLWTKIEAAVLTCDPHTGGTMEMVGSGGLAVALIGLCLLVTPRLRLVLLPLAALGSMPLTAYAGHVLVIFVLNQRNAGIPVEGNPIWANLSLGLLVGAVLWVAFLGRGPLERLVGRTADAAARGIEHS